MARPTVISDERILDAARAVFLERGLAATTAEVAKRAGVAEGTIFKRFATKLDLFKAAMQVELDEPEFLRTLIAASDDEDPREVLVRVGLQAVDFLRKLMPLIMMQWSSGEKHLGIPAQLIGPSAPPLRFVRGLATFVDRQMRAGRMRKHDAEIVARMLMGSIQGYVFFEILLRAQAQMPIPVEDYLRGVVNVLWTGAGPAKRGQ